jgi:putative heme-binding domain-containing protein
MPTTELARQIDSPNGTIRDTVQRLLVHRSDLQAAPSLRDTARSSRLPQARLQALGTLEGLAALSPELVRQALADPAASVRRQAVRLSEPWLGKDETIGKALLALERDPAPAVRFQLALSLGAWDAEEAGQALVRLALAADADPWIRDAALSSATSQAGTMLAASLAADAPADTRMSLVVPLIATLGGSQDADQIRDAVAALAKPREAGRYASWQIAAISELYGRGMGRLAFPSGLPEPLTRAARAVAQNHQASPADRAAGVGLLGWTSAAVAEDSQTLEALLDANLPASLEPFVAQAVVRLGSDASRDVLRQRWPQAGPRFRALLLDAFGARPDTSTILLDALAEAVIVPAELDASTRERLLHHPVAAQKARAEALLAASPIRSRARVIDAYRPSIATPGRPERGKAVFSRVCAACHKLGGEGSEVGPDLAALTENSPEALLTAILDPSRDVDARYASYTAALSDGRVLNGLIASETANAITLKRQGGATDIVLRADLEEIRTAGLSLMPEGLENDIRPEDMADLIAYVAAGGARPKLVDGNTPRLVSAGPDGSIRLSAAAAEIYGPTLTYETALENLGYWHSAEDRAVWTFTVTEPTTFTVSMEWACAEESAGNRFAYRVGSQMRETTVGSTGAGTWSQYRTIFLGEVTLAPGNHRLEIRPVGEVRQALMDLRAVVLSPRIALPGARP